MGTGIHPSLLLTQSASLLQGVVPGHPERPPAPAEERKEEPNRTLYGAVLLLLPRDVSDAHIEKIRHVLEAVQGVTVVSQRGGAEGTTLALSLTQPIPLMEILGTLPEVVQVAEVKEERAHAGGFLSRLASRSTPPGLSAVKPLRVILAGDRSG